VRRERERERERLLEREAVREREREAVSAYVVRRSEAAGTGLRCEEE